MSTTTERRTDSAPAPTTARWAVPAVVAGVVVLGVALLVGGGVDEPTLPGITDTGPVTRWALPLAKVTMQGAAAVTVGFLLLAAMLPARDGDLGGEALRALRVASWSAGVWTLAAAAVHLFTLSDLVGLPLRRALTGPSFLTYTLEIDQGLAYAAVVLLTASLVLATRVTLGHGGAVALLVVGIGALVPPALVGHSSSGDYHHPAAVSLLVHVVGVALWIGGLVAVSWYAAVGGRHLPRVAASYSAVALAAFVMVAASGALNGAIRVTDPLGLLSTPYGWLLSAKVVALGLLGSLGWTHRRRTLGELERGRPGAFRRLAAGEVVLMGATLGLAVALSRTPPPVPEDFGAVSRARELLGFAPPPEVSPLRLVTLIYPEPVFALGCLVGLLLYVAGVARLRSRGDRWPVGRTIAWLLGLGVVAVTTLSGLQTYGMVLLSAHMTQHMVLAMLAPVLLVLGAPVTLALRALRPARRGETGPREWVLAVTRSPAVRVLTHPIVAFAIFVSAPFVVYFTGLFEYAMRHHTAHTLMSLHFLAAGYLFYEVLIGVDPLPRRPPYPARVGLQFGAMAFHAIFGLALMESAQLVAGEYFLELGRDMAWLPDPLDDQQVAGQLTWGFGEVPALVVLAVLVVQWVRSDERDARRFDRREADTEAERIAYNAYLAELDRRSRGPG
ncbi:MAG TPA: cytochrome c oxidase assembly protein [Jiangellales bacterium]|nr:cytochrome c oxidase assembly protein [Jiangellales bacterium]